MLPPRARRPYALQHCAVLHCFSADVLVAGTQCACLSVIIISMLFSAVICLTMSCGWRAEVTLGTMTFGVQAS